MGARAYWRVLRDRWPWVVAGLLVGALTALALILALPTRYSSETSLLLDVDSAPGNATAAYDGELLAQQKVQAYVPLFTGPQFAGLVTDELIRRGIADDPQSVQGALGATSAGESPVIRLTATATSAAQAQDRASAAATAAANLVASLETPDPQAPSALTARVVAAASPPGPPSPGVALILSLGLLLGLAAGGLVALVRDAIDRSVRSAQEVEAAAHAPLLGVLDNDRKHSEHPLALHQGVRSERAEAIQTIRTALSLRPAAPRSEVLLVTSALPGEGKTSVACDLAIAAAQAGRRVLLVGADLRRPRFANFLSIEESVGVSTIVAGRASRSVAIQRWGGGLLDVLPAGRIPDQPLQVIGSEAMRELLDVLRLEYDLVLLDTPPVLAVSDASVLGGSADGCVLVAALGHSTRKDVEQAASRLRMAGTLLGVVVDRVRPGTRPRYVSDAAGEEVTHAAPDRREEADTATVAVPSAELRYRTGVASDAHRPRPAEAAPQSPASSSTEAAGLVDDGAAQPSQGEASEAAHDGAVVSADSDRRGTR